MGESDVDDTGSHLDFDPTQQFDEITDLLLVDLPEAVSQHDRVWIAISRGFNARTLMQKVDALEGSDTDPISPGDHFISDARKYTLDTFEFSVVLAAHDDPDIEDPIGYASLKGGFTKREPLTIDQEPHSYDLRLHLDIAFIDNSCRGQGYGRAMGFGIATPIKLAMKDVVQQAMALGVQPDIHVHTWAEILRKGGGAVNRAFCDEINGLPAFLEEAHPGSVKLEKITHDHR